MKNSYHDYSDLNDRGYQYYHIIVKMCWKCSESTDTLIVSASFGFKINTIKLLFVA